MEKPTRFFVRSEKARAVGGDGKQALRGELSSAPGCYRHRHDARHRPHIPHDPGPAPPGLAASLPHAELLRPRMRHKHIPATPRARAAGWGGAARVRVVAAQRHVAGAGQGVAVSAAVGRPRLSCPPPPGAAAERGFPRHHERCWRAGV